MQLAVLGAGGIGISISHALAEAGHQVLLVDHDESAVQAAPGKIKASARLHRLRTGRTGRPIAEVVNQISCQVGLTGIGRCSLVIENIVEDIEAKRGLYVELGPLLDGAVTVAANTSSISIDLLAASYAHPASVIGVHFMNPVSEIATTEVVRGTFTSTSAIAAVEELLQTLGKKSVMVGDRPGFVSNRVSHLMMSEAASVVADGVASAKDVDQIFRECFGHRMGPLETADLIGLDTVVHTLDALFVQTGEEKFRAPSILRKMVESGRLGRKSGTGFHTYSTPHIGKESRC